MKHSVFLLNRLTAPAIRRRLLLSMGLLILFQIATIGAARGDTDWGGPFPAFESNWFVDMSRFSEGAHTGLDCGECHGEMVEGTRKHPDPDAPGYLKTDVKERFDYSRCKRCHLKAHERSLEGAHAEAMKKQQRQADQPEAAREEEPPYPAPTCGHCHSAHYDRSQRSRVAVGRAMTETCGACHPVEKATYLENYHGRAAVDLGRAEAAYCTDCHGAHACVSLKKEAETALSACRRCHPDAGENFADIVIHYSTRRLADDDHPKRPAIFRIYVAGLVSLAFISILLIGFYSHSFLLMLRKIHDKLRRPE